MLERAGLPVSRTLPQFFHQPVCTRTAAVQAEPLELTNPQFQRWLFAETRVSQSATRWARRAHDTGYEACHPCGGTGCRTVGAEAGWHRLHDWTPLENTMRKCTVDGSQQHYSLLFVEYFRGYALLQHEGERHLARGGVSYNTQDLR